MSEFELLAIPIALVLGLGVTQILGDVTEAIRSRHDVPLHWLPFAWAFLIFLFQVGYFFAVWDINQVLTEAGQTWTWNRFWPAFFHAVLLFLGAGLILPTRRNPGPDLLTDFEMHGRLALVPLALALLVSVPLNVYQHGAAWTGQPNVLNVLLSALICVTLFSRRGRWQGAATVTFAAVQSYAMLFVWSQPGG